MKEITIASVFDHRSNILTIQATVDGMKVSHNELNCHKRKVWKKSVMKAYAQDIVNDILPSVEDCKVIFTEPVHRIEEYYFNAMTDAINITETVKSKLGGIENVTIITPDTEQSA